MAGETTKSARLTSREDDGLQQMARVVKGNVLYTQDNEAITTGELEATDMIIYDMPLPSNAVHDGTSIYNDDLDSDGSPTLAIDIGLFAIEDFTSVTGGTETLHMKDSVLDADVLVDGATDAQAATTDWTRMAPNSSTFGPDAAGKAYWELLGYDEDPQVDFRVGITVATAAATGAAGDLALRVDYTVD